MSNNKKIGSKAYQYRIVEVSFDNNKLSNFPSERGISDILSANETSEEIMELQEELLDEVYEIVNGDALTEHQKKILMLRLMGKTQNEIAKHLRCTQSAVHKSLHGNIDYKNNKKRYGGIIKKLKKVCENNEKICEILGNIQTSRKTDE